MKLAIVGSRDFTDYELMQAFISDKFLESEIDTIVSGGARGADALAEQYAHDHNLQLIIKKADWHKYGRAAGPIRNKLIVEEADAIAAFPSNSSTGTLNTMKLAREMHKQLEVCYYEEIHPK